MGYIFHLLLTFAQILLLNFPLSRFLFVSLPCYLSLAFESLVLKHTVSCYHSSSSQCRTPTAEERAQEVEEEVAASLSQISLTPLLFSFPPSPSAPSPSPHLPPALRRPTTASDAKAPPSSRPTLDTSSLRIPATGAVCTPFLVWKGWSPPQST